MTVICAVFFFLVAGCDVNSSEELREAVERMTGQRKRADLPHIHISSQLEDGFFWHEQVLTEEDQGRVWIMLPPGEKKVPCVVLAPAAMAWKLGGRLGLEDKEQMLYFVRSGFAVVGFDVPGAWEDNATLDELGRAIDHFIQDEGGVNTGRGVLDLILARLPRIDSSRVFTVGEGPAGTLAFRLAAWDRRISAVIAFDPVTDMEALASSEDMQFLTHLRPRLRDSLLRQSPAMLWDRVMCPVLLYHDSFSRGDNFDALDRFYLEGLRRQKSVSLLDTMDVDPEHADLTTRTARSLRWLESLGH